MDFFKKNKFYWLFFLFSLFIFGSIFFLVRHFMFNIDEIDNILAPFLMSQGKKFYSDIFNMHFPLPFYFSYIFTPFWVSADPSRAIAVFRLSLLVIYFFSFFTVFIAFKNPKSKISFSLWIIIVSILVPLYHGNLYLSETFTTIFISSIFWLSISVLLGWEKLSKYHFYLLIIFASLSFWTQPLTIILFLIPLFFIKKDQFFDFVKIAFLINITPIIFFLLNGQFSSFLDQAIFFNSEIYSKFFPEQINNYSMFYQNFLSFFKNEFIFLTNFKNSTSIFQFVSHYCLIILFIIIILQKKSKPILIFTVLILSVFLRGIKIVPGSIFNFAIFPLLSISSASALLLLFYLKKIKLKIFSIVAVLLILICNLIDFSPIFKQSLDRNYNYDAFWSYRQRIGEDISNFTKVDEKILIYPHDSDLYFFAKRQPLDKFPYWYPWIDSSPKFKSNRQQSLKDNPPALIYIGSLAYKDDPNFYGKLFPNLLENYLNIQRGGKETNYWLRNDLKSRL